MLTDAKIAAIKPPATGQQEHPDHKVTGLRLRVGAGGVKAWTVRRRVGAKIVNRKLGTYPAMKLAQARVAAEKLIEALERDGGTESLDRTFGQVAKLWLSKVDNPEHRSRRDQERQLETHVYPAWQERKIAEIKRRDVRDLIDGLEGAVLPNRILSLVKTIFRFALSRDLIEASPVEGIQKPKSEAPRDRVLAMDEITRIWAAAELVGYPQGHWARILLLTGQRRSEVAGMRWADIDRKAAIWTLPAADTKASRAQLVPLSSPVMELLDAAPELGEYVFTTTADTPISGFAKAKTLIDRFIAAKGEPLAPWRFHDLRRSAATHMVRLGIAETVVSRVLNHATQGITATTYALHSYAPEKRHALDTWAAEVDRAVNGERGGNVVALSGRGT